MSTNRIAFDYSGTHVMVAGGTSGIGAGIAAAYRSAGAIVTVTGTRQSAADYDEDLSGYQYQCMNIEDFAQIAAVTASLARLDILVNSAGIALASIGLDEYEPDTFARAVNMHLTGAYRLARGCLGRLRQSTLDGGASVIGIASMSSFFGISSVPGYGAAKSGLVGMTRALAVEWAQWGIRVNAVAAGLTESRMTAHAVADPGLSGSTLARTPAGRLGKPDDIASAVLFLTGARASWITGQTLAVDGGYTIAG